MVWITWDVRYERVRCDVCDVCDSTEHTAKEGMT